MSGIQPTGIPHLGNYFGAIQQWINLKSDNNVNNIFLMIADLHAMTPHTKPHNLKDSTYNVAASLIACGLSDEKISLFKQSQIGHHACLSWILMCLCPLSRVQMMPTWKEKLEQWSTDELPNTGLLMYPILQASDILLYAPDLVPVGEDQVTNLNLTRYLRSKLIFWRSDDTSELDKYLVVPQTIKCQFPKISSLTKIGKKMSKSDPNVMSRIELNDGPDQIVNKITKALTDSYSKTISYNVEGRPALSNLINIYCATKGISTDMAMTEIGALSKCQFKDLLANELIAKLEPIRLRMDYLLKNRDEIDRILQRGQDSAEQRAAQTMDLVFKHIGLSHKNKSNLFVNINKC